MKFSNTILSRLSVRRIFLPATWLIIGIFRVFFQRSFYGYWTKLKSLRTQNGLTQQELADRAELTKGFISQVERNLTSPSISTLADILQCLGSSLQEFLRMTRRSRSSFREEDYFLKDDPELGHQIEWLVPNAQKNQMEPIRMTLAPPGTLLYRVAPMWEKKWGTSSKEISFLHWARKPTAYKKVKRFIFPPTRNTGWKQGNGVLRSCGSPPLQISNDKKERL